MSTSLAELRRRILKQKDVTPAKHTRKMLSFEEQPDDYPKTSTMKYIELKYRVRLEKEIYTGSLNDVCKRFNYEIDRSTISRWRKHIRVYVTIAPLRRQHV